MILFLYGSNSYLRQQRINTLRQGFQEKYDVQQFSIDTLDGSGFSLDEFRKMTRSAGLFAEKRFILFENIWAISKDDQTQLIEELQSIPEETVVVISSEYPPRKDNALFAQLLQSTVVEEYGDVSATHLRAFITKECTARGATITGEASQQLINTWGNDLWALHYELNKLAHYAKNITADILDTFAEPEYNENIFHLTDAVGVKNTQRASRLLEEQFHQGANEQYIITMLARHFSTLLKIKQSKPGTLSLPQFVIEKTAKQASYFTTKQLLQLYWQLLHIDQEIKTRTTNAHAILQRFIIQACQ